MSLAAVEKMREKLAGLEEKEKEKIKVGSEIRERNEKEFDRLVVKSQSVRERLDKLRGELRDLKLKYDPIAIEYVSVLLEAETVHIEHNRVDGYLHGGGPWGAGNIKDWVSNNHYGWPTRLVANEEHSPLPEDLIPTIKGSALFGQHRAKKEKGKK